MIEKIIKGNGARGLAEYLLSEKDHNGDVRPRHDIVGGTFAGRNARELAAEIGVLRRMRPNLHKAVGHVSLRVPENERALSDQEWAAIGDQWAAQMGMDSYCTVCHGDHIHILFSRINSDGSVVSDSHDYKRGEAAVRKIEEDFNLVRVESSPLLEPEKALNHKKAPTKGDFIAMEKGEVPARIFLQNSLDAILEKAPTVTRLIDDLEGLGVIVEPNIAPTTEKLSGFAYHYGGYRFTSNSLGRGYTFGNMQKKGLSHEQTRDIERIRAAKDRAASFIADRRTGDDPTGAVHEAGIVGLTRSDSEPGSIQLGADGGNGPSVGPRDGYPEGDHPTVDRSGDSADAGEDRGAGTRPGEAVRKYGEAVPSQEHANEQRTAPLYTEKQGHDGGYRLPAGRGQAAESPLFGNVGDFRGDGRVPRVDDFWEVPLMAWNTRFKQASAAKRRGREQPVVKNMDRRAEFERLRDAAHMADLVAYMQSIGLPVKKDGVKDWIIDEGYRVTKKPDGHFVWCSWDQSRGGDPISFCTDELGISFQQALADLSGSRLVQVNRELPHVDRFPTPPPVCRNSAPVMQYLEDRGISQKTALLAQGAGFLRFVDYAGTPGVAFCGLGDNGKLRSMTVRLTQFIRSWDDEKEITKLDIRHSDKSFPPIWRGDDPSSVWVVEGGMDALAIVEWHKAHRKPAPCIIVSGGAGVRSFLDQPRVQKILKETHTVYVAMEHEKNQETQARTDTAHEKQMDKICDLGCEKVIGWTPPAGEKDIADAWKAGVLPDPHDPLAHMLLSADGVDAGTTPQRTSTPMPDASMMTRDNF
ncbi:relaxase/mobilization nuclease domain-containing protein [Acidithiobacillus ferridurans]|uniref:relaxase/mobilization nuclease domain-containing protein n=1 Tax=Acidithiobacillus ferridurans TaxID=1232575 RepID=UPI001C06DFA7|nr:relaxase/mobilization nuclease domain-containing protein [Acidithiobacillus ferridurans]MBU2731517.1 hypothetical protein [Acidithiobacillus ferridurans]